MKSKDIKSLAYAFISEDINVYFPDNDEECFIIEKLICKMCRSYWHTSLNECYFCGELNYYIYVCTICGEKYSITNSTSKCTCKNPESELIKACVNQKCISNTDTAIKAFAISEKGVFDLDSSLSLSQMYCIKCGSPENHYLSFKIFVYNDNEETNFQDYYKRIHKDFNNSDILIIKNHQTDNIIKYATLKSITPDTDLSKIDYKYKDIISLIKNIFI